MTRVGAYEAKTHLPKLLERVESGESIVITRHGEEVAYLVPPPNKSSQMDIGQAITQWKKSRRGVNLSGLKVRDLIDEGRR